MRWMYSFALVTVLLAAVDLRADELYVSVNGSDKHDGRSPDTAVRTIARVLRTTRHGDTIRLERGGEYDSIKLPSAQGVTFAAYGDGPRPILRGDKAIDAHRDNRYRDITFEDLHLIGEGGSGEGVVWRGATDGLTFRRCVIEGYRINILIEGKRDRLIRNVTIDGCVIKNASHEKSHSHGVFTAWVQGLTVRDSLFDRNGWSGEGVGTPFNHALYVQTSCTGLVFENNISSRNFADGGQFRTGGVVRDNISVFNPIGYDIGGVLGGQRPRSEGVDLIFENNIVAYPGDINPNQPRGIGVRLGNLRSLRMTGNRFLFARGGDNARNTAIRIVDVGEARLEQLDARDNIVHDFPREVEDRTNQNVSLAVTTANHIAGPDEEAIHNWLDEAATQWGEPGYNTAALRQLILNRENSQTTNAE